MVEPIWQALSHLEIEGEYCDSAVDAVERVTTQLFQIVITDWDDQPEAAFLLKTARDLKAANRPLTLAIVRDGTGLPEALKAGANSVLLKPVRTEQVRDTMRTACELLRAKIPAGARPMAQPTTPEIYEKIAMAAAAGATGRSTRAPKISFRAGEFLQSAGPAPGAQFDTESENQTGQNQSPAGELETLTDLEPTASAVPASLPQPMEPEAAPPQQALTGWVALQARLGKSDPQPVEEAPGSQPSQLLTVDETHDEKHSGERVSPEENRNFRKAEPGPPARSEDAPFHSVPADWEEPTQPQIATARRGKMLLGVVAAIAIVTMAIPATRQIWRKSYETSMKAGGKWLNPPPARLAQVEVQHDSFAHSGDEYALPPATKIPESTTDASQIQVVPMIDPTAKPNKLADANNGVTPPTSENPGDPSAPGENPDSAPAQADPQIQTVNANASRDERQIRPADPAVSSTVQPETTSTATAPPSYVAPAKARLSPPPPVSTASRSGIPSSLRSQIASMTPEASGAKPVEAAMTSIEPVRLPEATTRDLLAQSVDPEYPAAARASGQRGGVILEVLIGRDGVVQDAKFLQGSLVFARAAIDAVRRWRFKPYSMNGRAVAVQSTITLNFKPSV